MTDPERDELDVCLKKAMTKKIQEVEAQDPAFREKLRRTEARITARRVEVLYYCLYTKNGRIPGEKLDEIVLKCAKHAGVERYASFDGPQVQDPVSLWVELQQLDTTNYNFILFDVENDMITLFGQEDWTRFMDLLQAYKPEQNLNSGQLARLALQEEQ